MRFKAGIAKMGARYAIFIPKAFELELQEVMKKGRSVEVTIESEEER